MCLVVRTIPRKLAEVGPHIDEADDAHNEHHLKPSCNHDDDEPPEAPYAPAAEQSLDHAKTLDQEDDPYRQKERDGDGPEYLRLGHSGK